MLKDEWNWSENVGEKKYGWKIYQTYSNSKNHHHESMFMNITDANRRE